MTDLLLDDLLHTLEKRGIDTSKLNLIEEPFDDEESLTTND